MKEGVAPPLMVCTATAWAVHRQVLSGASLSHRRVFPEADENEFE
jgi:hypothetical protein